MGMLDRRFRSLAKRYVLQSGLAMLAILIVLWVLDTISNTAIIAALGASSFVAFAMPKVRTSKARYLIGGYVVGMVSGVLCYFLSELPLLAGVPVISTRSDVVFGALAVGLAMFGMVVTNTEHPPAAGLALGFVLNEWDVLTIVVVVVGIVSLSIIKTLLEPVLVDLV
jgi:CBS-domain-containing membrane protein